MTAHATPVTLDDHIASSEDVLIQEVGGEAVLLDLASERYFGLDQVGTRIWQLIEEIGQLRAIHARLCVEFDAEPLRIEQDLLRLASDLGEAGLVKIG